MVKDIAIYGAGGFGKEIACLINVINRTKHQWNLVGFFDDNPSLKNCEVSHFGKCLGGIEELNAVESDLAVVIAIGNPNAVRRVSEGITNHYVTFPNLICSDFYVADLETFSIGRGNIIQGGCRFSCNVRIGDFNVFNGDVVLGHDVKIGGFNTFMPAVRISGEVEIADQNFFGVNSVVLQQMSIGKGVRLAAGSVLFKRPKDGMLYVGVPAKKIGF